MNVFSFVNDITYGKHNIYNDDTKKHYEPYMVNRALSYFPDCVLYANDLNMYPDLPKYFQYLYYLNSITKRKRFSKWGKRLNDADIIKISNWYQCNMQKALEYKQILTTEQISQLP